jgi:hypothetical protein
MKKMLIVVILIFFVSLNVNASYWSYGIGADPRTGKIEIEASKKIEVEFWRIHDDNTLSYIEKKTGENVVFFGKNATGYIEETVYPIVEDKFGKEYTDHSTFENITNNYGYKYLVVVWELGISENQKEKLRKLTNADGIPWFSSVGDTSIIDFREFDGNTGLTVFGMVTGRNISSDINVKIHEQLNDSEFLDFCKEKGKYKKVYSSIPKNDYSYLQKPVITRKYPDGSIISNAYSE